MGQYDNDKGGIYLVEDVEDIAKLTLRNDEDITFMTQTTLSIDDTADVIKGTKTKISGHSRSRKNDICYATTNRQQAVRELAELSDLVIVVGSKNSSNSNRLAELASRMGVTAKLIDDANDIEVSWLNNVKVIGLTSRCFSSGNIGSIGDFPFKRIRC